jgi:hypothetical protein
MTQTMSELDARRRRCAEFEQRWAAFVQRWNRADRDDPARARKLVARVLDEGIPETDRHASPDRSARLRCAMAVVGASGYFDESGYVAANRLLTRRTDPLLHFVETGWRDLRAPSLRFDLWWYTCSYLDPTAEDINPLLHFLLAGRQQGFEPVPPSVTGPTPARTPTSYPAGRRPRRACLFAGYDRDGLVDDSVVHYLRELARHADVFFLADGVLEPGQLDRLEEVAAGAWGIPHASYDFGSWSMLARDLVGWDRLAGYDEVILANDSCFVVRPLDDVLAEMDGRACDWWSLQATSMEFNEDQVGVDASMPLEQARAEMIGPRRWTDVRYLHLSSYFQVLRRPVLDDPGFRLRLDTVCGQRTKQLVVDKYEIGIGRYLMDAGFHFETWADALYPFHPLYSRRTFDHVAAGFPLVKRNFLAENPRDVPGFEAWPEWLLEAAPEAPIDLIRRSIERVSPDDRVRRSVLAHVDEIGVRVRPKPGWQGYGFRWHDNQEAKLAHWWAFPVSPDTHRLDPGARAVFEAVRDDPTIHKVVLTQSRRLGLTGEDVVELPMTAREGQVQLMRCREIFVDRTPRAALGLPTTRTAHHYVHVGAGLPIGPTPLSLIRRGTDAYVNLASDYRRLHAVLAASRADALARAASTPLGLHQVWLTGLPRHDLVVRGLDALPDDLRTAELSLRQRLGGRRLLVLWPRPGRPARSFTENERTWLADWCRRHDTVLGVREGQVDHVGSHTQTLTPHGAWSLSVRAVPDSSVVLRVADVVLTDDADEAVDFLLTGRPLVHLLDEARSRGEDHLDHYPPDTSMPGPVCTTFEQLATALETVYDEPAPEHHLAYDRAVALAFAHTDDLSGWRVVERVRRQYVKA